jgi:hypothetical protein
LRSSTAIGPDSSEDDAEYRKEFRRAQDNHSADRSNAGRAFAGVAGAHQSRPRIALDLEQLTLVDVEAVRFLGGCRRNGMALLNCSPYIREWIAKEQKNGK